MLAPRGEEKVIGGRLTLRQFVYLAAGAGLSALALASAARHPFLWAAVPIPAAAGVALAFVTVGATGLALDSYLARLLAFRARTRAFPYLRRGCSPPGAGPAPARPGAQDVLGFADVQGGVVALPGSRWRLVCEVVGRVNFHLLSPEEQARVDARFQRFVLSLSFPVEIAVQSRYLDISGRVDRVTRAAAEAPAELAAYARDHAGYLRGLMASRVLVQRIFLVVPYDGPDPAEARAELERRANLLRAALGEDLSLRVLDTGEVLDVLYAAYNRERALYAPASQAADYGFVEPVVRGVMPSEVLGAQEEEQSKE